MRTESLYYSLQYIPFASTAISFINIGTKLFYEKYPVIQQESLNSDASSFELRKVAQEFSNLRNFIIAIPVFGNITIFLYDRLNALRDRIEIFTGSSSAINDTKYTENHIVHEDRIYRIQSFWLYFLSSKPITVYLVPVLSERGCDIAGSSFFFTPLFAAKFWTFLSKLNLASREFNIEIIAKGSLAGSTQIDALIKANSYQFKSEGIDHLIQYKEDNTLNGLARDN